MKVREIVGALDKIAPPQYAADWDNVGLLVGDSEASANKMMLCIDLTEQVLAEAIKAKATMVMAYHPVIFKSISRLTAQAAPVVHAACARGIAIYSMHTALDVAPGGTNDVLADLLGIKDARPIEPLTQSGGYKVIVFTPPENFPDLADAAFDAGAGTIGNYDRCTFFSHGIGTYYGGPQSKPAIGQSGRQEAAEEIRLELITPASKLTSVCDAIRAAHVYETPAIDIYRLAEAPAGVGMGRIGRLPRPVMAGTLINRIKKQAGLSKVLLASPRRNGKGQLVSIAACAAGSCGSMYKSAAAAGATFYLTGEMRHHDALAATAAGLTVLCLGHSNSERMTLTRLVRQLKVSLPKLAVSVAKSDADPFTIV